MKKIHRLIDFVEKYIFQNIAIALFMFAIFWMVFEALSRFFLSKSYNESQEIITFCILWAIMLSFAEAGKKGLHIRIDLLLEKLPVKVVSLLDVINMFLGIVFSAIILYSCYLYIPHLFEMGLSSSSTMRLPMWAVYLVIPIGGILLLMYYIREIVRHIRGLITGVIYKPFDESKEIIVEENAW